MTLVGASPRAAAQTHDVVTLHAHDDIASAARRSIALLGGMESILAGRKKVILKPNFVAGRPARTGATTHFDLIAAVADEARAAGAQPYLCESPGTEFDFDATYSILGIREFCEQHDIGIVGQVDRWVEYRPPKAQRLKVFHGPAELVDSCLINLPVLKTHVVSGMSVAMKNLMGLLPRNDRRSMHTFGIQQSIVDLNMGIKPDLTIVDGMIGQDGEGPLYGRQANLGVLLAGRDSLTIDLVACKLVNVDPMTVGHLRLGLEQLGGRRARTLGDKIAPMAHFEMPVVNPLYRFAFWMMYPLDYVYEPLAGNHLCTSLYNTGLVGTRPKIDAETCTHCGKCVEACPLPNVIDLKTLKVNPRTCQRCLLCYEACPEGAISVKGMSGATAAEAPAAAAQA